MLQDKITLLNDIGFIWVFNELEWNDYYQLLKEYKETYGNLNIPQTYKINDINLGQWVNTQRKNYKNNKLLQEKINLLNDINFI